MQGQGVFLWAACCLLLHVAYATEKTAQLSSDNVLGEKPIIIETPEKNYDQPTLREYKECHERRDKCLSVCSTNWNKESCDKECPLCPVLINQDVLVQGINDTDYRAPVDATINTTNIIRLTNEIRNLINTRLGNITLENQSNVQVKQNISLTGGKFGHGFNEHGDCCQVVRSAKSCQRQSRSIAGERCYHKRIRVCGERCQAPVMYANRVLKCNKTRDECEDTIQYSTTPPKRHTRSHNSGCRSIQQWPFVACGRRQSACRRCQQIPYGYVLQYGVPQQCMQCPHFMQSSPPMYPSYYPMYPGYNGGYGMGGFGVGGYGMGGYGMGGYGFDGDEAFGGDTDMPAANDWTLSKKKCRDANGDVVDCDDIESGSGNDEQYPIMHNDEDYSVDDFEAGDDDYDFKPMRRYPRSRYSKRNKQRQS